MDAALSAIAGLVLSYDRRRGQPGEKEAFLRIADTVQPEMLRGAVNRENYGKNSLIYTDVVALALVYRGIKPLCWIAGSCGFFDELGLDSIEIHYPEKRESWLVFHSHQRPAAEQCARFLHSKNDNLAPYFDFIVGHYMGYPIEDIIYFHDRDHAFARQAKLENDAAEAEMPELQWHTGH